MVKSRSGAFKSLLGFIIWVLIVLGVGIWGYVIGVSVRENILTEVHSVYNHIRIYEDGSYEGQLTGGTQVSGCIEGALCND